MKTQAHGLSDQTLDKIRDALIRFPAIERAVLFGSRAKGTHKPGSDIDLALTGDSLDWRTVGQVYDALDDLLLPYEFSLIHRNDDTDPEVTAHIDRVGIAIFDRKTTKRTISRP